MDKYEETVREEVSDRLGRELTDAVWRSMYGQAREKLRHIVTLFGDAGGARNTVDYIAQLTVEAIQADALHRWPVTMYQAERNEEPAQRPTPRGHTNIIPQDGQKSQAVFV